MSDTKVKLSPGTDVPDDIRELFEKHQKYLAAGRANYAKADKLLDQLLERCEVGVSVVLEGKGKKPVPTEVSLVDQFADANAVWCGRSMKRFDISAKKLKPQDRKVAK